MNDTYFDELTCNRIGEIRDAADRAVPLLERIAVALERIAVALEQPADVAAPEPRCSNCGHVKHLHVGCLCGAHVGDTVES